jgi:hypothetical protein
MEVALPSVSPLHILTTHITKHRLNSTINRTANVKLNMMIKKLVLCTQPPVLRSLYLAVAPKSPLANNTSPNIKNPLNKHSPGQSSTYTLCCPRRFWASEHLERAGSVILAKIIHGRVISQFCILLLSWEEFLQAIPGQSIPYL